MPPNFQYDDGAMPQAGGASTRANWSPYVRAGLPSSLFTSSTVHTCVQISPVFLPREPTHLFLSFCS